MAGVYFADTFYWIALNFPRDFSHARVAAWSNANGNARLVTTEEVLSEYLTWFSGAGVNGRANAADTVVDIGRDAAVQVLPQTSAGFQSALALYRARLDKDYSLVDCGSMVAMKSLGLSEILTNDHHFTQEGFTVLFL